MTCEALPVVAASSVIEIELVLEARITSDFAFWSSVSKIFLLRSKRSVAASTMKSADFADPARSVLGEILALIAVASASLIVPFFT